MIATLPYMQWCFSMTGLAKESGEVASLEQDRRASSLEDDGSASLEQDRRASSPEDDGPASHDDCGPVSLSAPSSPSLSLSTINQSMMCPICLRNYKNALYIPCGHFVGCGECIIRAMQSVGGSRNCLVCSQPSIVCMFA